MLEELDILQGFAIAKNFKYTQVIILARCWTNTNCIDTSVSRIYNCTSVSKLVLHKPILIGPRILSLSPNLHWD